MKTRIKWDEVVGIVKSDILPYFESQGVKPTLRTIFYALVSKNIIPNTKSSYKRLSRILVEARKEGIFEWDFMVDKTRVVYKLLRDNYLDESEIEYVERRCRDKLEGISLQKLLEDWFDYLHPSSQVGYWARQPTVVEVWIEKEALADTIANWVHEKEVNIRVNRGYSSWTFIYNNVRDIRGILSQHEQVVVLYLGDLDPSGVDIERFLKEALEYFGLNEEKVRLVRLAVTPEQVRRFNLPPRPEDAETLAKLERDPRYKSYMHEYIVELDSLVAYVPDQFRKLLRETIERYHDKEIYNELRQQAEKIAERCRQIIEKYKKHSLRKLLEEAKQLL